MWEMLDGDDNGFEIWINLNWFIKGETEVYSFVGLCRHRIAPYDDYVSLKSECCTQFETRTEAIQACLRLARIAIDNAGGVQSRNDSRSLAKNFQSLDR